MCCKKTCHGREADAMTISTATWSDSDIKVVDDREGKLKVISISSYYSFASCSQWKARSQGREVETELRKCDVATTLLYSLEFFYVFWFHYQRQSRAFEYHRSSQYPYFKLFYSDKSKTENSYIDRFFLNFAILTLKCIRCFISFS